MVLIDVRSHEGVIQQAAVALYEGLLHARHRDQVDPTALWEHCYMGKQAEAAMAVGLGVPVEHIIHDRVGLPDFPQMDVKATTSDRINVRADALRHTGWIVAGCRVLPGNVVELAGWLPVALIATFPQMPPAPGHVSSYVPVMLDALAPWKKGADRVCV
jgi:hypothetical protein